MIVPNSISRVVPAGLQAGGESARAGSDPNRGAAARRYSGRFAPVSPFMDENIVPANGLASHLGDAAMFPSRVAADASEDIRTIRIPGRVAERAGSASDRGGPRPGNRHFCRDAPIGEVQR